MKYVKYLLLILLVVFVIYQVAIPEARWDASLNLGFAGFNITHIENYHTTLTVYAYHDLIELQDCPNHPGYVSGIYYCPAYRYHLVLAQYTSQGIDKTKKCIFYATRAGDIKVHRACPHGGL